MGLKWVRVGMMFIVLVLLVGVETAGARVDPDIDWKTIETEHFRVVYNAKHQALATEYAHQAERAHALLVPIFNKAPEKTVLVLNDETDATNGFATPIPRSLIVTYPVLPTSLDGLGYYGNWGQELVTHEFTHILNFEPSSGLLAPFRFIFGSIVRPNALLPRWYLEGLAVYLESYFTAHGRLRSPFYRAMARAMIIENLLEKEDIARINETRIPTWPRGSRPYFMGALLWETMVRKKGLDVIGRLNERYSKRFPFFINTPAVDEFGTNYQGLLTETYQHATEVTNRELAHIRTQPVTQGETVASLPNAIYQHSPTVSPDGAKLIFIQQTLENDDQIFLIERGKYKKKFTGIAARALTGQSDIQRVSWFPNSQMIVFDGADTHGRYYNYSDLYTMDLSQKKPRRLTFGARAQEPTVGPDGKTIIFIERAAGETRLKQLTLSPEFFKNPKSKLTFTGESIYTPAPQVRIGHPEFLNTNALIFSERDLNGRERLRVLNLKTHEVRDANTTHGHPRFPVSTPNGLVYVSDHSGISNLYLIKKNQVTPLTNTETYIVNGTVDPRLPVLYVSRLTGRGAQLESAPIPEHALKETSLPAQDSTFHEFKEPVVPQTISEPYDYSGMSYLWPQYWIPFFSFVPDGAVFQASISAADPLEKHAYALDAGYDTLTSKPSVAFQYANTQTPVIMAALISDVNAYLYGFKTSTHTTSAALQGTFFVAGLDNRWSSSLGMQYQSTEYPGVDFATRAGPTLGVTYKDIASQKGYQISPMHGGSLGLGYTYFLSGLGNLEYGQGTVDGIYYFSKWLPEHHAIQLKANGIFSPANRDVRIGTSSAGGEYNLSLLSNKYVTRGYPTGEFIGYSLVTGGLEYRFPLAYPFSGTGTRPLFFRSWSGALVGDAITLEGGYFNSETQTLRATKWGTFYVGAGAEVRVDTTLAYHLPAQLRLGLYYGFNDKAYGGVSPYLGFLVEGF